MECWARTSRLSQHRSEVCPLFILLQQSERQSMDAICLRSLETVSNKKLKTKIDTVIQVLSGGGGGGGRWTAVSLAPRERERPRLGRARALRPRSRQENFTASIFKRRKGNEGCGGLVRRRGSTRSLSCEEKKKHQPQKHRQARRRGWKKWGEVTTSGPTSSP